MTTEPTPRCPFPHDANHRKTGFSNDHRSPGIERQGNVWHLRSYAAVRQVLRDADRVCQGATTGNALLNRLRPSVIFQDGVAHREQRTAIARFFTPKTVHESYDAFTGAFADRIISDLTRVGKADLSALSMQLAVEVAARVVGLTDSRQPGMDRRIDALLSESDDAVLAHDDKALPSRVTSAISQAKGLLRMLRFYLLDVCPAIRARRKVPREDVISHLLSKGYNDLEILVECLTYAVAGMVTTREFIGVAAWHLLENEALRQEYLTADQAARHRLLHEILRLEPVASTLLRRAESDVQIKQEGVLHTIPVSARMVLDIRTANADPAAIGSQPLEVCPHRSLPSGVQPQAMSFGDGPHRCPGAFLAIHESDLFLQHLLRLPLRMVRTPHIIFNEMLMSYEIRNFEVVLDPTVEHSTPSHA